MLFNEYHQISKNRRQADAARRDHTDVTSPEHFKTTYYKSYDRFPHIVLPKPESIEQSYSNIIIKRESGRNNKKESITLQALSNILYYSCGELSSHALDGRGRRAVSSAGARYPLEVYILTINPNDALSNGLYHYRPDLHVLEYIYEHALTPEEKDSLFIHTWVDACSLAIVMSSLMERNVGKYKERGYRYTLLEAGAMGQALQNASTVENISSCIYGGIYDNTLEELLDVDGVTETIVNTVVLN